MKEHQWINSRGKRLAAMIHRAAGLPDGVPVIILCHGFTADKVGTNQLLLYIAKAIETAGFAAVRFDFAGSGESEGEFASDTIVSGQQEDLRNVISWVKAQPEYLNSPIILLGHSLGGMIALLQDDSAGKIAGKIALAPVLAPINNFRDILIGPALWEKSVAGETIANFNGRGFALNKQFVADLLAKDYAPLTAIKEFRGPLLIVHGTRDAAEPLEGSKQLFAEYAGPKALEIIENADHVFTGQHHELQTRTVNWLQANF